MIESLAKPWGELALYHSFGKQMVEGLLPYKDFLPEYPPLAMPFFWFAQLFGTQWFTLVYYGEIALFVLLACLIIKRLKGNPFAFLAAILPLGGLFWDRFDIFPATLSLLAIYLALRSHLKGSAFILGLATLVKVYPLILLPVVYLINRKKWKEIILFFLAPIIIVVLVIINYSGKEGLKYFWEFQGKRGTQLESIRAMPAIIKHLRGVKQAEVIYEHNTFEIK